MKLNFNKTNKEDNTDWSEIKTCKNCGHVDTGHYCSNCGQHFKEINKPFKEIIWDLLGALSLDSSIFRTMFPFLFNPGFITSEYLAGRRKKYLSPIRLYLFLSILFFFVARVDSNTAESYVNISETETSDSTQIVTPNITFTADSSQQLTNVAPDQVLDSLFSSTNRKSEWIGRGLKKALENKSLYYNNLLNNFSYALFLLMPLFALILQLLYVRRKRYYVEHLIFSLNMHSFTLLILSLVFSLRLLIKGNDGFINFFLFIIPVYFTIGMKRFYKQGVFKTILKELILAGIYGTLLIAAVAGLALLTLYRL